MPIRQVDPIRAHERLASGDGTVCLDVRSVEEFGQGHIPGALNIPLIDREPATGRPRPNQDFLRVVQSVIPVGTPVIVGCASGARSQQACEMLAREGYSDLGNLSGGLAGRRGMFGQLSEPGWMQKGLPLTRESPGGTSCESLRRKADARDPHGR